MSINATLLGQVLAFGIAAFFVLGVVVLIVVLRRGRKQSDLSLRLVKLDELLASGNITSAEHERQRASIISGV